MSLLDIIKQNVHLQNLELNNAREIQQFLIKKNKINDPFIEIKYNVKMAHELGGDFYYFLKLNNNQYMISCFDVSGKNISAALETIMLSSFFSSLKFNSKILELHHEKIMEVINYMSYDQTPPSMFISAIFIFVDKEKREMEIFNCGFTCPFLYYKNNGGKTKARLLSTNFPPLGIDKEMDFSKGKKNIPISNDLKLFIYSDGLLDATNKYGRMYGEESLKEFIIKNFNLSSGELLEKLHSELDIFLDNAPLADDITTMVIKFNTT